MITRPSKGATRPSCLAIQPDNVRLSMDRRQKLLTSFNSLDDDEKADLLETIEKLTFMEGLPFGVRFDIQYGGTKDTFKKIHNLMESHDV